jgi:dTDP-4-dehydrorhamnose 3,5-epimerase
MLYLHTAAYQQSAEGGLNPQDPALGIRWPEAVTELSSRDAAHPYLAQKFAGVSV